MRSRIVICIGIRRGAYLRARFREAERIARKGDVARVNNEIPYRHLPPANCIRSECRTSLSLRQRMTVFGFSAGVCCRSVRARGYAPLRRRMTVFGFSAGLCCRSVRARGYAPLRGWRTAAAKNSRYFVKLPIVFRRQIGYDRNEEEYPAKNCEVSLC